MSERKIFAGPRIRRIRNERGLTQTAMAEALQISPSYLNLIERNQRPLTVQLLLRLASTYKLDLDVLQSESGTTIAGLREVFADPLLSGELPGDQELVEVGEAAPNAATGIVKLYRAYREQQQRLSDLSQMLSHEGREAQLSATRLPLDEVRDVMARRANHYPHIEAEAESFHTLLKPDGDLAGALKDWLRQERGIVVRTLPVATMPNWRRRYDRHSQRLFISERLSPFDQLQEIAMEAALIRMQVVIGAQTEALKLSSSEAKRIARFELARYAAQALMMPYRAFRDAAVRGRYDVDVLSARFGVSFQQAANRLTTLQREGESALPFFLMEIDHAGNRLRMVGAEGFPIRFGGQCPKLPVYAAFAQAGQVLAEAVTLLDGPAYLTIVRTLEGLQSAFHERPRRTAILLGCAQDRANETVYDRGLATPTDIGPACRLCERQGCITRAEPPLTRPLGLDEMVAGLSAFDFQ